MTSAGFAGRGRAARHGLDADQCELLWKMAEEPILCFDGDRAGRKAAYRAIDTALPLIGPGRSLGFALLPEGRRSGRSRPLRRTRGGLPGALAGTASRRSYLATGNRRKTFATPERHAGFELRLAEIARRDQGCGAAPLLRGGIQGTALRILWPAIRATGRASPVQRRGRSPRANGPRASWQRFAEPKSDLEAPPPISLSLSNSPLFRAGKSSLPPREGLILLILLNHPGLIGQYIEDLAEIVFSSPEEGALRDALIAFSASSGAARAGQPLDGPNQDAESPIR